MSDDRQHRIRQRAHAIWESHGRPHGHDRDHWDQATREIDAEDRAVKKPARAAAAAKPKTAAKPKAAPKAKPAAKSKAKEKSKE
jgi:hypothetical protein